MAALSIVSSRLMTLDPVISVGQELTKSVVPSLYQRHIYGIFSWGLGRMITVSRSQKSGIDVQAEQTEIMLFF